LLDYFIERPMMSAEAAPYFAPSTEVEHTVVDGRSVPRRSHRITALDMDRDDDYQLYMPTAGAGGPASDDQVITELDGVDRARAEELARRKEAMRRDSDAMTALDLHVLNAAGRSKARRDREERNAGAAQQSGSQSARAAYSRKDPRRVVRISPRAKKTYNTWKKFEKMYQDDRDNNVNPLFMSSMGQYEDMWAREMAQARASKSEHVDQKKPWVVTPHHAAVAKRARMQAQTSVTARGPYIPPHEAHRRFFFDRRKWLHGAWHIPAPSGSFTMRGSAFAAASAVTKGQRHADDRHIERHATTSRKPLHGGHGPSPIMTAGRASVQNSQTNKRSSISSSRRRRSGGGGGVRRR
jgi:hypothetical protein